MKYLRTVEKNLLSFFRKGEDVANIVREIAPVKASAAWAFVFIFGTLFFSSCHIFEYPDENCGQNIEITLDFNTAWDTQYYDYTRSGELSGEMRYIVRAYSVIDGNLKRDIYKETVFTREVARNYDCSVNMILPEGEYRLMVWSDFVVDGRTYYDGEEFSYVTLTTVPYSGGNPMRDAFCGNMELTVTGETEKATVEMHRPLAKFTFISTALTEFLEQEAELNGGTAPKLSDYYAIVRYPQYMPSAFNMFMGRNADSATGIQFNTNIVESGEDEATLGWDFVFMNLTGDSKVAVQVMVVNRKDDRVVASTPMIQVPIQASFETIVKGDFLLRQNNGGVGIDPGFNGEFTVFAPLVES